MKLSCLSAAIAIAALPVVAACSAAGDNGGWNMNQITATVENAGFTCEAQERHPKKVSQVAQCRSDQDKYLILTVSQWNDPNERDQMYEQELPKMCDEIGLKDQVRWSSAGDWLLVAGGSKAKDAKALDQATDALGFEPHTAACQ